MDEITVFIPSELPHLKDLDTLLRCGICYEYMKTSMMTKCSHNYCSLCIRNSLMYRPQCPRCFRPACDNELRNNRIIDEITQVFSTLLDEVKAFMHNYGKLPEPPEKLEQIPELLQNTHSLSDSRVKYNSDTANNVCSNQRDGCGFGKLSDYASGSAGPSYMSKSEVGMSDCSDFVRLQNVIPLKSSHQSPDHRKKVTKGEMVLPLLFSPGKKHNVPQKCVPCPVCNVNIPEKNINVHLDTCLQRSENLDKNGSPTKVEKRKPLPKLVYKLLPDKALKEKLKQHGLNTHGDRKALISRHQRFTLLYNSESDNLNPKSTADIIKQLEMEEQEEKLCAGASSANKLKIDVKTDPELIEHAQQQYLQNNKSSYAKLIESIRNRETESKTGVKRKLILSHEESLSEDGNEEARVQDVSEQKCTMRSHMVKSDEDAAASEMGHKLCGSVSPVSEKVSDDNTSEEAFDMNYEAQSPVLGRNIVTNCSRKVTANCYEGGLTINLTVGMFGKKMPGSSSVKCSSAVQRSEDAERAESSDGGSNQSISILSEHKPETVLSDTTNTTETDEAQSRMPNRPDYDPDFEPYSEDTSDCFDIRTSPVQRRKKMARLSPKPASSRERRSLRKLAKF